MNYRTKIKALIQQVSPTDWEFTEACKPKNIKVFPFYCHTSLCKCRYVNNELVMLPGILCDDYPDNIYESSCYWGWVVGRTWAQGRSGGGGSVSAADATSGAGGISASVRVSIA